MKLGTLFVVATPIGNMADMTFRAVEVMKSSHFIYAEDTRVTAKILERYQIKTPLKNYHQHSGQNVYFEILTYLNEGKDIAVVTDAGTPGISDPAGELVAFIRQSNALIKVTPVPGASALTAAISISGMHLKEFIFVGFLPKKKKNSYLKKLSNGALPIVFYESAARIRKTISDLGEVFPTTSKLFLARELTKMHETVYELTLGEALHDLNRFEGRGEYVVIVFPA